MRPQRVVIIGAARSGTKLLRDTLSAVTGAGKVPYDIGYVWTQGSPQHGDEVIDPGELSAQQRDRISTFVDKYAAGHPPAVIEKSVGNCMRVPAVQAVLPDARFIHLVRDGADVVESARRQWVAPVDFRYLARKAAHIPLRLAGPVVWGHARSLLGRRGREAGRVSTWGPRYPGIDEDLRQHGLLMVCARQWRESVRRAQQGLDGVRAPVVDMRYEDFVTHPEKQLQVLAESLDLPIDPQLMAAATRSVSMSRCGAGRRALTADEKDLVRPEIEALLVERGYSEL